MNSYNQLNKFTNQWFVALVVTSVIASLFYLHKPIIVENIGEIQFSQTLQEFNTNVAENIVSIRLNTYYDFLFITVYTILFYLTYRVFQSSMRIKASKLLVLLCLVPGLLDIVENIFLLDILNNPERTGLFNAYWIVVRAKWTFIIPFFIINVTILVYYILRLINSFVRYTDSYGDDG